MNTLAQWTSDRGRDGLAPDAALLARFVNQDDEAAFAVLVSRYGGLVFGVCRRVLHNEHDAEDAFQATFLVLARRAGRIRKHDSLASWLYAVAYRTALRANQKRPPRPQELLRDDMAAIDDVWHEITNRHEQRLVDEALNQLPIHYREPLVLRYFMDKSNKQIAHELGLTVGVVEGRLKRGKDSLRLKLAKRGIGLTVALAAVGLSQQASAAALNDSLVAATTQAAAAYRSGTPSDDGYSQNAAHLADKELAMSTSGSLTFTSGVAVAILLTGLAMAWAGNGGQPPTGTPFPAMMVTMLSEPAGPKSPEPVPLAMAAKENDPFGATDNSQGRSSSPSEKNAMGEAPTSPTEQKIAAALAKDTQLEFIETPLQDVIDFFKDFHQIEIQIDQRALDDVGIGTDTPITRNLKGISLRTALRLLLRDLDLTYTTVDGVLLITTPPEAKRMPITRVYPVGDLLGPSSTASSGENWLSEAIVHLFPKDEIQPESITLAQVNEQPVLIVSETYTVHEEIERLLTDLRRIATTPRGPHPPGWKPQ